MAKSDVINKRVAALVVKDAWRDILKLFQEGALEPNQVINDSNTGMNTPILPVALRMGWVELAEYLIDRGADTNKAWDGDTPLIQAVKLGHRELIESLLKKGAKVDAKTARDEEGGGETSLILAAEKADLWGVRRLLEAGADPKALAARRRGAMYYATFPKPTATTREVISALVSAGAPMSGEELHAPVYRRDVETAKLLLDSGCPANTALRFGEHYGPKKGATPLTTAAASNADDFGDTTTPQRAKLIRMLLDAGADPNLADGRGWTPLMFTVVEKEIVLAEALVESKADPEYAPSGGKMESPAKLAAKKNLEPFINLFQKVKDK